MFSVFKNNIQPPIFIIKQLLQLMDKVDALYF